MLNLLSTLICATLLSTNPTIEDVPTKAKARSFDASAYVTVSGSIRLAVEKSEDTPVSVILRNEKKAVLFQKELGKNDQKYALKLDVSDLQDGLYELEVKSDEGTIRKQVKLATKPMQTTDRMIVMN